MLFLTIYKVICRYGVEFFDKAGALSPGIGALFSRSYALSQTTVHENEQNKVINSKLLMMQW